MQNCTNVNWEQTLIYQKEKIRALQNELDAERRGVEEMQAALNGILLSLLNTFGEERASGERVLSLPPVALGGDKVTVSRGEKGGYTLRTSKNTEVKGGK